MRENFVQQYPSWEAVGLSLLFYGALLWVPPNLSFVLVGRARIQALQFRLAVLGSVYLAKIISVFRFTESYLTLILAICNWLLLVFAYLYRDNLASKP